MLRNFYNSSESGSHSGLWFSLAVMLTASFSVRNSHQRITLSRSILPRVNLSCRKYKFQLRQLVRDGALARVREQTLHGNTGPMLKSGRILVQFVPQPPTTLAVSVYTHTAQKPVAPSRLPLYLGRKGRGKVISVLWLGVPALSRFYLRSSSCTRVGVLVLGCSCWGTRVVSLALTFHLYAWSISLISLVLTLWLFLGYQRFLARTHPVVMLRIIVILR